MGKGVVFVVVPWVTVESLVSGRNRLPRRTHTLNPHGGAAPSTREPLSSGSLADPHAAAAFVTRHSDWHESNRETGGQY